MARVDWNHLPIEVRDVISARVGGVFAARTASEGLNSEIALFLEAGTGRVFVKGRPIGKRAVSQRREAAVNPYVRNVAPRLLWQAEATGWDLLGFEQVPGHHADYAPGSDHLDPVLDVLRRLGAIRCPDLPKILYAERRWSGYLDDPTASKLFVGETLLHTDFNPLNVLINSGNAHMIDWAWPTRGAAFIDPACWILRLIAAGHSTESAEEWARQCPTFKAAAALAVTTFAVATCRLWDEIAQYDPVPWKQDMAKAARMWLDFRQASFRDT